MTDIVGVYCNRSAHFAQAAESDCMVATGLSCVRYPLRSRSAPRFSYLLHEIGNESAMPLVELRLTGH